MTYCQQLIEFLTARLDEDEELARATTAAPWSLSEGDDRLTVWSETAEVHLHDEMDPLDRGLADADSRHIARHDPARVLLDIESKRQLVAYCGQLIADADADSTYEGTTAAANVAQEVLELLVLPYAGHPDCDPEWLA